jgi:hypothetical protein
MPANSPFDESAKTWDQDPVKLARRRSQPDTASGKISPRDRFHHQGWRLPP